MSLIYEHFHAISPEKQQRILNAAFREFARNGYGKTSVGQIVESAGIAKGMLFHYFGSKLGLYEYLFTYSTEFLKTYFENMHVQIKGLDYIEQYRYMTQIKLRAYTENPYVFEFYSMLISRPENTEVSTETKALYEGVCKIQAHLYTALDESKETSGFRDDMAANKIKTYVAWFFEGYTQSLISALSGKDLADMDLGPYWTEFNDILGDLKKLFYKHK